MKYQTEMEWKNHSESVMENVNFIRHAQKEDSDMLAAMMGMHASFTISDETMELLQ